MAETLLLKCSLDGEPYTVMGLGDDKLAESEVVELAEAESLRKYGKLDSFAKSYVDGFRVYWREVYMQDSSAGAETDPFNLSDEAIFRKRNNLSSCGPMVVDSVLCMDALQQKWKVLIVDVNDYQWVGIGESKSGYSFDGVELNEAVVTHENWSGRSFRRPILSYDGPRHRGYKLKFHWLRMQLWEAALIRSADHEKKTGIIERGTVPKP